MTDYKEDIKVSITKIMQNSRDMGIKRCLDILDTIQNIAPNHKKILRKAILEGFNDLYNEGCNALTYVQEQ